MKKVLLLLTSLVALIGCGETSVSYKASHSVSNSASYVPPIMPSVAPSILQTTSYSIDPSLIGAFYERLTEVGAIVNDRYVKEYSLLNPSSTISIDDITQSFETEYFYEGVEIYYFDNHGYFIYFSKENLIYKCTALLGTSSIISQADYNSDGIMDLIYWADIPASKAYIFDIFDMASRRFYNTSFLYYDSPSDYILSVTDFKININDNPVIYHDGLLSCEGVFENQELYEY